MTGYLDEMLARQALAAEEQRAAARLLQRLRDRDPGIVPVREDERWDESVRPGVQSAAADDEAAERRWMDDTPEKNVDHGAQIEAVERVPQAPDMVLLQRLAALAAVSLDGVPGRIVSDIAEAPRSGISAAWSMRLLEQRLARAMTELGHVAAQSLPSAGARDLMPGGMADAAALSRLYERDARRYDGCFEMPL